MRGNSYSEPLNSRLVLIVRQNPNLGTCAAHGSLYRGLSPHDMAELKTSRKPCHDLVSCEITFLEMERRQHDCVRVIGDMFEFMIRR